MMYYVLYVPQRQAYLDEEGYIVSYEKAEKYAEPSSVILDIAQDEYGNDVRWVGPCKEGEVP